MWKKMAAVLLCAAFTFAGVTILATKLRYRREEQAQQAAAERFTSTAAPKVDITSVPSSQPTVTPVPTPEKASIAVPTGKESPIFPRQTPEATDTPAPSPSPYVLATEEPAPIQVDFESLQAVNHQVVGWIYCPDTPIHYAVCHGPDDSYYLDHRYDGAPRYGGAIFMEAANRPGFVDANMILYGHHMQDGSMFSCLDKWKDQDFYEAHPMMFLLTPERDYRVDLVAGCTVSAVDETYTVYYSPGTAFSDYLTSLLNQSDFKPMIDADENAQYLILSTCNYAYAYARYVLVGMLTPLDRVDG